MTDLFLSLLADLWPSPIAARDELLGGKPGSQEYGHAYAIHQYMAKVKSGLGVSVPPLWGKDVLEIGCGHGGITCYLASIGAKVVGIDLNTTHVRFGEELARQIGCHPVFMEMNATQLDFADSSFDVVYADNCFEHFDDPELVMREAFRVLRADGWLVIPVFSSIYSKYGLHLKRGLKLPWANLLFSERTIIKALQRQARKRPELLNTYPGLNNDPQRVRDVRKHRDLNDITYTEFRRMAEGVGFEVKELNVKRTRLGRVLRPLRNTIAADVLSTGASALLRKPQHL